MTKRKLSINKNAKKEIEKYPLVAIKWYDITSDSAWQEIIPIVKNSNAPEKLWDIVGPVCETGDFLGKERMLKLAQGDLLAIRSSGAYGFSMSSNYNSRPRVPELMVDGNQVHLIRERESLINLWSNEHLLP